MVLELSNFDAIRGASEERDVNVLPIHWRSAQAKQRRSAQNLNVLFKGVNL